MWHGATEIYELVKKWMCENGHRELFENIKSSQFRERYLVPKFGKMAQLTFEGKAKHLCFYGIKAKTAVDIEKEARQESEEQEKLIAAATARLAEKPEEGEEGEVEEEEEEKKQSG